MFLCFSMKYGVLSYSTDEVSTLSYKSLHFSASRPSHYKNVSFYKWNSQDAQIHFSSTANIISKAYLRRSHPLFVVVRELISNQIVPPPQFCPIFLICSLSVHNIIGQRLWNYYYSFYFSFLLHFFNKYLVMKNRSSWWNIFFTCMAEACDHIFEIPLAPYSNSLVSLY